MLAPAALLFLRLALLLLLLLLLLGGALPGTGRGAAEKPPQQVNGLLGGSALFPLDLPPAKTVAKIEWSFQVGSSSKILIAELRDGKLERQNASSRLGQRLEMAGETTLRIRALEKEDSGVFMARVVFATGEIQEQTFLLSVFGPVPDPHILFHMVSRTAEGCNLTLKCLASEKGGFNVSWKRGDQLGALEEHSDWYRLSAEGTELHLLWRPDSSDSTLTCLLSNPADQKNASFDLLSICPSEGHSWTIWLLLLAGLVLFLAATLVVTYLRKRKSSQRALPLATPEKARSPPELQYAEVRKRRSPPKGNEDQRVDLPTTTSGSSILQPAMGASRFHVQN
ncbi:UNVERIFIED_CONTAM: hypothetical protein K2H54_031197 [Gekko kuhli]